MVKKFRCKKSFSLPAYDENCEEVWGKEVKIELGQIYTLDESGSTFISAEIHLDGEKDWIEISKQTLEEYFEQIN